METILQRRYRHQTITIECYEILQSENDRVNVTKSKLPLLTS